MSRKLMFERLHDYNTKKDDQLLDLAEQLSDEQLHAPQENGHKSLAQTFSHMLVVEWAWAYELRERKEPTDEWLGFTEFPGLEALRERHQQETALMTEYLAGLSDEQFDERFEVDYSDEAPGSYVVWELLMHRLLHSAQHRSELAFMLTQFGHSPGGTDYLFYTWEHPLDS